MKRSAGILTYKVEDNQIKVLLCHCGGPYRSANIESGWSIPKGEYDKNESALDAAKREFNEETNLTATKELSYLASKKISNKKLLTIFSLKEEFDLSNCKSNYFEIEYPKGSGKIEKYPEMDKYEWIEINKAKKLIFPKQTYFLDRLNFDLNNN